ncbi:MAG: transcriptional regulator [Rickettsiales bacterium]|nr:transcriptional regulator [Rickettsiales bacterium]
MSTLINNLKAHMARHELNARELAKRADVKPSFIYDILSGKSANPSSIKLARVAQALRVNLADLVQPSEANGADGGGAANHNAIHLPYLTVAGKGAQRHVATKFTYTPPFAFNATWLQGVMTTEAQYLRILHIEEDSMHPTLHPNDHVIVDVSRNTPSPPGIFALFDGHGIIIKRLEYTIEDINGRQDRLVQIRSDNPHYTSYEKAASELDIIGRIVWVGRNLH